MTGVENSSRARWTGWIMVTSGFFLLLVFLGFVLFLYSRLAGARPTWGVAIPIALAVTLIVRGIVWIMRAKRANG